MAMVGGAVVIGGGHMLPPHIDIAHPPPCVHIACPPPLTFMLLIPIFMLLISPLMFALPIPLLVFAFLIPPSCSHLKAFGVVFQLHWAEINKEK